MSCFTLALALSLKGRGDLALTMESDHRRTIAVPHHGPLPAGKRKLTPFSLAGRSAGDEG